MSDYPDRTYPHGALRYSALEVDFLQRWFDTSQKVIVYWPAEEAGSAPTLVGYYATVSAGQTARTGAIKANGSLPAICINHLHPDIVKHEDASVEQNRDAEEDLPSWIDEAI